MKIYHNPRCTKSRQTLQLIESAGKEVEIVEYLTDTPTKSELKKIIARWASRLSNYFERTRMFTKRNSKEGPLPGMSGLRS